MKRSRRRRSLVSASIATSRLLPISQSERDSTAGIRRSGKASAGPATPITRDGKPTLSDWILRHFAMISRISCSRALIRVSLARAATRRGSGCGKRPRIASPVTRRMIRTQDAWGPNAPLAIQPMPGAAPSPSTTARPNSRSLAHTRTLLAGPAMPPSSGRVLTPPAWAATGSAIRMAADTAQNARPATRRKVGHPFASTTTRQPSFHCAGSTARCSAALATPATSTPTNCRPTASRATRSTMRIRVSSARAASAVTTSRAGVKRIDFDHDLTRFPLIGLHAAVPCEGCHLSQEFKGTSRACNACHKDTHHEGRLGSACEQCHNPNGWPLWRFDHATQTKFDLTGAHAAISCHACHREKSPETLALTTECYSCHSQDDKHRGAFGRACGTCHSTTSFAAQMKRR